MTVLRYTFLIAGALSLWSCEPDFENKRDQDSRAKLKTADSSMISLVTDLNGDGKQDTLFNFTHEKACGLYSSLAPTASLTLADHDQNGLFVFENLGDLNGDMGDEIGYVVKWTDESNINTYHIVSFRSNTFKELFSFQVNELVSFEEGALHENGKLIKLADSGRISYRFFSDTATVETAEHTF